jgi:hypothetical protein
MNGWLSNLVSEQFQLSNLFEHSKQFLSANQALDINAGLLHTANRQGASHFKPELYSESACPQTETSLISLIPRWVLPRHFFARPKL